MKNFFCGVITALLTPFKTGVIDEKSLKKIIDSQVDAGVNALVILGTTGESSTISSEERESLIKLSLSFSGGRIPILVGVGSNSTEETVRLSIMAEKLGADGIMVVAPYYNKPSQDGLYQHFKKVSDSVKIPIMLYNVPSRTSIDMSVDVIIKLSKLPNVIALKECNHDPFRLDLLKQELPQDFAILSGDDANSFGIYFDGCVSVASNLFPHDAVMLQKFWLEGKLTKLKELNKKLMNLYKAIFCETNPIAVKYMAELMGVCSSELRLPLVIPSDSNKNFIKETLSKINYEKR